MHCTIVSLSFLVLILNGALLQKSESVIYSLTNNLRRTILSDGSDDPTLGGFIVPDTDSLSDAEDENTSNVSQQGNDALVDNEAGESSKPEMKSDKEYSAHGEGADKETIEVTAEDSDDGGQSEIEEETAVMRWAFQDPLERWMRLYEGLLLIRYIVHSFERFYNFDLT